MTIVLRHFGLCDSQMNVSVRVILKKVLRSGVMNPSCHTNSDAIGRGLSQLETSCVIISVVRRICALD